MADNHLRRRWEAAFQLEAFGGVVIDGTLPLLQHRSSGVRAAAIWLLGRTGDASHIKLLEQHLNDYTLAMPGLPGNRTVSEVATEAIEALQQRQLNES